jgi:phosphoribosylpyrophosphate synthetase
MKALCPEPIYFSNVLGVDMGMFYKRRDYSKIVNGKNPIVAHEFLGDSVEGKDCIVIDDMISSGGSMLDVATQLEEPRCPQRIRVLHLRPVHRRPGQV